MTIFLECNKDNGTNSDEGQPEHLVGIWVLTYMDVQDQFTGDPADIGWHSTIRLNADGSYVESGDLGMGTYTEAGTWSATRTEIVLILNTRRYVAPYGEDGDTYVFTITLNSQDIYMYTKQD